MLFTCYFFFKRKSAYEMRISYLSSDVCSSDLRVGLGTTTRIVLPLTLAILDGITVQSGDEVFILPLSNVSESIQPTPDQLHSISEGDKVLHVREIGRAS